MADRDAINSDLPCSECGYNLRGLSPARSCPECDHPVATSVYDHRVARPRWLRCVSIGSILISAGLVVGGAGLLISFWPPLAAMLWRRGIDQRTALWLLPVGALVSGVGTWWFATPTPGHSRDHARSLAAALRVVAVVTCTVQLQLFLFMAAGFRGAMQLNPEMVVLAARALLVAWSAAALLTCARAADVAGEVGDRSGVLQAWLLALLAPLTLLYFATAANLVAAGQFGRGMLIAWAIGAASIAGWSALFFAGFAVVLYRFAARSSGGGEPATAPPAVAV